jgi:hypothetical protein
MVLVRLSGISVSTRVHRTTPWPDSTTYPHPRLNGDPAPDKDTGMNDR